MSDQHRILKLIIDLSAMEAPGFDDPRDARMNVGKFHQKAREELIKIGAPAVPYLIEYSNDPKIRELLKEIGEPAIMPLLTHLQESPKSAHVESVVRTLGLLHAETAADLLFDYLQKSDDLEVRTQAAVALGFVYKDRKKIDALPMLKLMDDLLAQAEIQSDGQYKFASFNDSRRCEEVVGAIGHAGDERATEPLVALLGKTKGMLNLRVVQALGNIGDERAVVPIIENIGESTEFSDLMTKELLKFKDPSAREFAEKFIQENPSLKYIQQVKDELEKGNMVAQSKPAPDVVKTGLTFPKVKALYMMVFGQKEWEAEKLREITTIADGMLRAKDATFKRLLETQMVPASKVNITGLQYSPMMHTPQSMQTSLMGWLTKGHNLQFMPTVGENFFPHGMKDPDGNETFVLFYFDMEDSKEAKVVQEKTTNTTPEKTNQETPAPKSRSKKIIIAVVVGVLVLFICGAVACLVFPFLIAS